MAPTPPHNAPAFDHGQVVRAPAPTDGVGRALRQTFERDARLPAAWTECLKKLEKISH